MTATSQRFQEKTLHIYFWKKETNAIEIFFNKQRTLLLLGYKQNFISRI